MERKYIELDVCYGSDTLEEVLFELMKGLDSITCRIVNPVGPGGGWPVVLFEGEWHDLVMLIAAYFTDDVEGRTDMLKTLLAA